MVKLGKEREDNRERTMCNAIKREGQRLSPKFEKIHGTKPSMNVGK